MAGDKKLERSEQVAAGFKSELPSKQSCKEMDSKKDGIQSDSRITSISSAGDATSVIKVENNQASDQGVNCPPTSYYDYYYPGYNGGYTQLDDHSYYNAGGGSYPGFQSDNGSFLYYLPGYNAYTGGYVGNDGKQPYGSSGYLQQPVPYGSESLPSYLWDPTYAGDNKKVSAVKSGNEKSIRGQNGSVNSNDRTSYKVKDAPANRSTNSALDLPAKKSSAGSNFSKSSIQTQSFKPAYKMGYGLQPAGIMKGLPHVGKFSPFTNQNRGPLLPYQQMNYQSNGRVWSGNYRYKSRDYNPKNGEVEASTELTRGPRASSKGSLGKISTEDGVPEVSAQKNTYNSEDFRCEYENAKFYIIKSFSEDDVHKCIKYDVWSSTRNGNQKLDAAFRDAETKSIETGTKCPVFLFFSVNGSGQFIGIAEMIGQVDFNKNMDFWQLDKWNGFFPVKWHIVKDIPNSLFRHITLENNENRVVTYSRDTQEVGLKQGLEMLKIFKSYTPKSSMLDDFDFYENREKALKARRNNKPVSETDRVKDVSPVDQDKEQLSGGEPRRMNQSSDSASSLVTLTKNLSINPQLQLVNSNV